MSNINALGLEDKSPQGFVDEDIIPLLDILNKKYETRSSCSGRITLMKGVKKGFAEWIYKDHFNGDFEKIWEIVSNLEDGESLRFILEPFIIHVRGKTLEDTKEILKITHVNGFKRSGLISFKTNCIEINGTGKMETLVTNQLSKEYMKVLVDEANRRLQKTKDDIKRLEKLFS